jgi:ABC-type lipoprotein release transport system permease subunit
LALAFSVARLLQFQFARRASRSIIASALASLFIGVVAIGISLAMMPSSPADHNPTHHRR